MTVILTIHVTSWSYLTLWWKSSHLLKPQVGGATAATPAKIVMIGFYLCRPAFSLFYDAQSCSQAQFLAQQAYEMFLSHFALPLGTRPLLIASLQADRRE